MPSDVVIGIDFGTTNSAAAYVNEHGKVEIIANREGERVTPSVVLFDDDSPLVGTIAKRSAVASPLNVCQFVKRQMGDPNWRFITDRGREYSAEEVSAFILRRLKEDASTALGVDVTDAVITVPAYFNDAQRKATQDAGVIAGLNVLRIVNEPTAAALAYGLDRTAKETIVVYDLGGGTFDVTIMRTSADDIDVVATGGNKNLGGFDWDNKLMEFLNERFQAEGGDDLLDDLVSQQDLRDKAEIAKKVFTSRDQTTVFLSKGDKTASIPVSRAEFENLTVDLLNQTRTLMEMTLEEASLDWDAVDKILLVGGSTRMKCVPALVRDLTGIDPSAELHPDEVVAHGAALLGALLQKERGQGALAHLDGLPDVRIADVNSHSLGVVALEHHTGKTYNSIILQKNTHIPASASSVYQTVADNQTAIEVEVTEGEDEDLDYVRVIGQGTMPIPPYPKGAPVEVSFSYDNEGLIHVTVRDMTSDKQLGELQIERRANKSPDQIERMRREIHLVEVR